MASINKQKIDICVNSNSTFFCERNNAILCECMIRPITDNRSINMELRNTIDYDKTIYLDHIPVVANGGIKFDVQQSIITSDISHMPKKLEPSIFAEEKLVKSTERKLVMPTDGGLISTVLPLGEHITNGDKSIKHSEEVVLITSEGELNLTTENEPNITEYKFDTATRSTQIGLDINIEDDSISLPEREVFVTTENDLNLNITAEPCINYNLESNIITIDLKPNILHNEQSLAVCDDCKCMIITDKSNIDMELKNTIDCDTEIHLDHIPVVLNGGIKFNVQQNCTTCYVAHNVFTKGEPTLFAAEKPVISTEHKLIIPTERGLISMTEELAIPTVLPLGEHITNGDKSIEHTEEVELTTSDGEAKFTTDIEHNIIEYKFDGAYGTKIGLYTGLDTEGESITMTESELITSFDTTKNERNKNAIGELCINFNVEKSTRPIMIDHEPNTNVNNKWRIAANDDCESLIITDKPNIGLDTSIDHISTGTMDQNTTIFYDNTPIVTNCSLANYVTQSCAANGTYDKTTIVETTIPAKDELVFSTKVKLTIPMEESPVIHTEGKQQTTTGEKSVINTETAELTPDNELSITEYRPKFNIFSDAKIEPYVAIEGKSFSDTLSEFNTNDSELTTSIIENEIITTTENKLIIIPESELVSTTENALVSTTENALVSTTENALVSTTENELASTAESKFVVATESEGKESTGAESSVMFNAESNIALNDNDYKQCLAISDELPIFMLQEKNLTVDVTFNSEPRIKDFEPNTTSNVESIISFGREINTSNVESIISINNEPRINDKFIIKALDGEQSSSLLESVSNSERVKSLGNVNTAKIPGLLDGSIVDPKFSSRKTFQGNISKDNWECADPTCKFKNKFNSKNCESCSLSNTFIYVRQKGKKGKKSCTVVRNMGGKRENEEKCVVTHTSLSNIFLRDSLMQSDFMHLCEGLKSTLDGKENSSSLEPPFVPSSNNVYILKENEEPFRVQFKSKKPLSSDSSSPVEEMDIQWDVFLMDTGAVRTVSPRDLLLLPDSDLLKMNSKVHCCKLDNVRFKENLSSSTLATITSWMKETLQDKAFTVKFKNNPPFKNRPTYVNIYLEDGQNFRDKLNGKFSEFMEQHLMVKDFKHHSKWNQENSPYSVTSRGRSYRGPHHQDVNDSAACSPDGNSFRKTPGYLGDIPMNNEPSMVPRRPTIFADFPTDNLPNFPINNYTKFIPNSEKMPTWKGSQNKIISSPFLPHKNDGYQLSQFSLGATGAESLYYPNSSKTNEKDHMIATLNGHLKAHKKEIERLEAKNSESEKLSCLYEKLYDIANLRKKYEPYTGENSPLSRASSLLLSDFLFRGNVDSAVQRGKDICDMHMKKDKIKLQCVLKYKDFIHPLNLQEKIKTINGLIEELEDARVNFPNFKTVEYPDFCIACSSFTKFQKSSAELKAENNEMVRVVCFRLDNYKTALLDILEGEVTPLSNVADINKLTFSKLCQEEKLLKENISLNLVEMATKAVLRELIIRKEKIMEVLEHERYIDSVHQIEEEECIPLIEDSFLTSIPTQVAVSSLEDACPTAIPMSESVRSREDASPTAIPTSESVLTLGDTLPTANPTSQSVLSLGDALPTAIPTLESVRSLEDASPAAITTSESVRSLEDASPAAIPTSESVLSLGDALPTAIPTDEESSDSAPSLE